MSRLFIDIKDEQWPIVYDEKYNVSFFGLESLHVFDAKKWGNVVKFRSENLSNKKLKKLVSKASIVIKRRHLYPAYHQYLSAAGFVDEGRLVKPNIAKKKDLLEVHTKKYLKSLQWSTNVATIAEIPVLACVPNFIVQRAYLKPMRLQTGGTVLAGRLAISRGWSINIGGGFHHCCSVKGSGFCPYADITLLLRLLIKEIVHTAMVLDLDAHQGNGYQRDFLGTKEVYIMDMYNKNIFPKDKKAKRAIRKKVELDHLVEDQEYLTKLQINFKAALKEFTPDILVYNAGTDILTHDPLGLLSISKEGIIERDEIVFKMCIENKIPIVMLTSGGYLKSTAKIIADSILNLHEKKLIYGLESVASVISPKS